jgi:hypothetical protein
MTDLPPNYLEKQAKWVKRMQKAGLFPPDPPAVPTEPSLPEGQWRMTSQPDGMVFVEVNNVPVPTEVAKKLFDLVMGTEAS